GELPVLIECKSAGDFTNTNKRRKEEAKKIEQLKDTYGKDIEFVLFLCGYFDQGYLGYEAADGIDWIWEHRIEDIEKLGI
ncbi:MAG: XamI family restriction endonuclease, partial [Prevotella sp.]